MKTGPHGVTLMNSGVAVGKNPLIPTQPGYRDIGNKRTMVIYGYPGNGVQGPGVKDAGTAGARIGYTEVNNAAGLPHAVIKLIPGFRVSALLFSWFISGKI
jgi:hypothetical protein